MLGILGLFIIGLPIFGFLAPALIIIFVPTKIGQDYGTFIRYLGLFLALVVAVSLWGSSQEASTVQISPTQAMKINEGIIIATLCRFALCIPMTWFVRKRLVAVGRSKYLILLLAVPLISPLFLARLAFIKDEGADPS
jgi:uncharacterized membrane protein YhaH (DUF805 family)